MGTTRSANQASEPMQTTGDPTPGPWSISHSPMRLPYIVSRRETEFGRETRFVAKAICSMPMKPGEMEANTHILAAAQDLLKACEDCMENRGDWAAVMGEAIRKARGQQ